jgi:CO/xanthine dehydrogenase FAD-binding subunit
VAIKAFILGALESVMEPGEMLETVHVPVMSPSARWAYVKSCRKTGEFALAAGLVGEFAGNLDRRLSDDTTFFATETTLESDGSAVAGAFSPA